MTTQEHTEKTTQKVGEYTVTFHYSWGKEWAGYVIHKEGNDYYEKSGGICINDGKLADYDGSFSLPSVVAQALEQVGIIVHKSFKK